MQAENCQPPLGISDEARDYLTGLKEGERVIECGQSGFTGHLGTVYFSEQSGTPTVCVRWDKRPGETGSMGTSATWGTRRLKDAGTFSHLDSADEPDVSDGCDSDGFKGGCERAGHTPENCPGFQIGDSIVFAARHIAAGDTGVIVAEEVWLDPNKTLAWDGVGARPAYAPGDYPKLLAPPARFLVRLQAYNEATRDSTLSGLVGWRERCLQVPHNYPFVSSIDMELVARPRIKRLNVTTNLGSVIGADGKLSCVSDSEAGVRKVMADMKASACLPLRKESA